MSADDICHVVFVCALCAAGLIWWYRVCTDKDE